MKESLERLNNLSRQEAEAEFLKCCGSTHWARRMEEARPFHNPEELSLAADAIWWSLGKEDWLEAFSRHPKIGERKSEREQAGQARGWSEQEQAGTKSAGAATREKLADYNRAYEEKFGFIYIVCATGKSAEEMLEICRNRLQNDAGQEIRNAAEEQRRITHLRLQKLLEQ